MVRRGFSSLWFVLAACSGSQETKPTEPLSTEAPSGTRDTLVAALNSDFESLNLITVSTVIDSLMADQLYSNLVDTTFDCGLKYEPELATEWHWSEDGKVLSMTLRDDLKWSDGAPVTAEDLAFTYELVADPAVNTARASYVSQLEPNGRPKIIDSTHIEWHFTEAFDRGTQMSQVSNLLVPKHILKDVDRSTLKGHEQSRNPVVNGPWKLAKHEPGQQIVLEPNEMFVGTAEQKPKLNRVIFKIIPEYSTRLLELQNGTVDFMDQISVEDADMLRTSHPEIKLYRRGWRSMEFVAWNLKDPKFSDLKVRQALAMAVNVDDIIGKLLTGADGTSYARRSVGTVTPALCGVHNDDIQPLPFDTTQAKALLAEAGWTDSNGDGILDKQGKRFEFTLITNADNKRRGDLAIRLQSTYKELGIVMNIEKLEFNAFTQRMRDRKFEATLGGWSAALFTDPEAIWASDKPERKVQFNYPSYSNAEVDALIEKGMHTPDPEQAAPIWKEMQAKIYEDQPYMFLYWMDEIVGVNDRFENVEVNIQSRMDNLHNWSVPADKVKYKR